MKLPLWLRNPRAWWRERLRLQRVRADLLATDGVDDVCVEVMDMRYGVHHWRVTDGMLEAQVQTMGQGEAWWGPIGSLDNVATRNWLINHWCELRGLDPPEVSHAKPVELQWVPGTQAEGMYEGSYADTEPNEEDKHD